MTIWILGRRTTLQNGHNYPAEPLLAFETNEQAQGAADLVQKISGERPMITSATYFRKGDTISFPLSTGE